ncbi:hypothetical protein BJX76DRAFT_125641 [Aspergillus varians]
MTLNSHYLGLSHMVEPLPAWLSSLLSEPVPTISPTRDIACFYHITQPYCAMTLEWNPLRPFGLKKIKGGDLVKGQVVFITVAILFILLAVLEVSTMILQLEGHIEVL